jgi:tetratricopeptide (TPR) repeat protein
VDHPDTLRLSDNLGILYSHQGKLVEAEKMYERALAGSEKALGVDHPYTLVLSTILVLLYSNQGKLVEAEKMYERALAGYEKATWRWIT